MVIIENKVGVSGKHVLFKNNNNNQKNTHTLCNDRVATFKISKRIIPNRKDTYLTRPLLAYKHLVWFFVFARKHVEVIL